MLVYSKKFYKIFYLFYKLYMYKNHNKYINLDLNFFKKNLNLNNNEKIKFYFYFYYSLLGISDYNYVIHILNNVRNNYFYNKDLKIMYIIYLKKKNIMYNKIFFNSLYYFKKNKLKVYFYDEFKLRVDTWIFVRHTRYIEYLRAFKYNEYLQQNPLLDRYPNLKGVLSVRLRKNYVWDKLKFRYKRNLALDRYNIYSLDFKLNSKKSVYWKKNLEGEKSIDFNFIFFKLILLLKDKKLIKLFWSFFKKQLIIYFYYFVYLGFYMGLYYKKLRNWHTYNLKYIHDLFIIQKNSIILLVTQYFNFLYDQIFYNTLIYKKNLLCSDIDNICQNGWEKNLSYWYTIINYSIIHRIDAKFTASIDAYEDYTLHYGTTVERKKFHAFWYLCSIWFSALKDELFTLLFNLNNLTIYQNKEAFIEHFKNLKDNLDYITYLVWSHISLKRYNLKLDIILKKSYVDRYIKDKGDFLYNYYFNFMVNNLDFSKNIKLKFYFILYIYDLYFKLSVKFKIYKLIYNNMYDLLKIYKSNFFKSFIILDYDYNSSVIFESYFKKNQVFYLEYCKYHYLEFIKPKVDYWCDWQEEAEKEAEGEIAEEKEMNFAKERKRLEQIELGRKERLIRKGQIINEKQDIYKRKIDRLSNRILKNEKLLLKTNISIDKNDIKNIILKDKNDILDSKVLLDHYIIKLEEYNNKLSKKKDLVSVERLLIEELLIKEAECREVKYKSEIYNLDKKILYKLQRLENLETQYRILGMKNKLANLLNEKEMVKNTILSQYYPEKLKWEEKLKEVQTYLYEDLGIVESSYRRI